MITAHIGGKFVLVCTYETKGFLYNKKYWCRGDSRNTCEILVDSDGVTKNTRRAQIMDNGRRGLFVIVSDLQFDDAGVYWVGIDKIYADIMTKINVVITEVPVSKPRLWPSSSLVDRATCWGQPVTVRCGSTSGTAVRYAWYRNAQHDDVLLHHSSELLLHCGAVVEDGDYYCVASNDASSQRSDVLSVQVLMPTDSSCIYVINMQGQSIYDCADRMSTTTVKPPPPPTTCQTTVKIYSDTTNQSLQLNQTTHEDQFFSRTWTGMSFWYTLLRWGCFLTLLAYLCIFIKCTEAMQKRARRRRKVRFRQRHHLPH
ncbi:hypothetical protein L3Q82_016152 [Scortum barcoo]|uniref:Uncharacterized protein n=1 Tax=Scortum barcoo TaxID=214431 RepID=A0ACB8VPZ0_9TELE|nr:hypothetical protein L3Q82_016152 [Scortum barcoo]